MVLAAIRRGRMPSLVRAFASSVFASPSTATLASGSDCRSGAGLSHLAGYAQLYGFERPCPPWRHVVARCRSWTELKDCKHWYITLDFPKDPAPSREEMIDTYVKTLAAVLGSEEEAKKKIYALSTTQYTGFQCNIDEATSEKLKEQPLVQWVLPDGYGDPELGIFGGDRYDNGVITPDPNPLTVDDDLARNRNNNRMRYERQRDSRPMEGRGNTFGERRDSRRGDDYNYRSTERRDTTQGYQRDNRRPFEQREPMQGYQRERMRPDDRRGPIPPNDRRDTNPGERRDTFHAGGREAVGGEGQRRY